MFGRDHSKKAKGGRSIADVDLGVHKIGGGKNPFRDAHFDLEVPLGKAMKGRVAIEDLEAVQPRFGQGEGVANLSSEKGRRGGDWPDESIGGPGEGHCWDSVGPEGAHGGFIVSIKVRHPFVGGEKWVKRKRCCGC